MKPIRILMILLVLVLAFPGAWGQSLRSIMKKKIIEESLKTQAEKDSIEAVEEGREPDKSPNTTMGDVYMEALGLADNDAYESSYEFDSYIQMEVSTYDDKGKLEDKMVYDTWLHSSEVDYAMEYAEKSSRYTVIFDDENSIMLMLSESNGEKSGMTMAIDPEAMEEQMQEYAEDEYPYEAYKTGRTREILGYPCDEYVVEEEEGETRMWASTELAGEIRREMLSNPQHFGQSFQHALQVRGMVLEYDHTDAETGERVVMKVTEIDLDRDHTFSTYGYRVVTLNQSPE